MRRHAELSPTHFLLPFVRHGRWLRVPRALRPCEPTRGTKSGQSSSQRRMAHPFRLCRVFRLAGILIAAQILLSLPGSPAMAMTLTSPAFKQNGQIPAKYTCQGDNISPPLAWDGVPKALK